MQQISVRIIIIFPGILFVVQIISSLNFSLALKLEIQESPEMTDKLLQRAEKYTAYWDVITLGWLPVSGILMIINHTLWPIIGLFGAAIYLDAAGREAARLLSYKHEGIRTGPERQHRVFFATYIIMAVIGLAVIVFSVGTLLNDGI